MQDWGVWKEVTLAECWAKTGKKPLGGRWVDVNKGDASSPDVRCRWVAKDIATYKSDLFHSATPPLEALRLLLSHAASGRKTESGGRKLMVIDAKKAHLHAFTTRDTYVDLPPEAACT